MVTKNKNPLIAKQTRQPKQNSISILILITMISLSEFTPLTGLIGGSLIGKCLTSLIRVHPSYFVCSLNQSQLPLNVAYQFLKYFK